MRYLAKETDVYTKIICVFPLISKFFHVISQNSFCHSLRLAQSIESLQSFSLSADPSFRHFQLDVSRELKLLTDLNFIQGENSNQMHTILKQIR